MGMKLLMWTSLIILAISLISTFYFEIFDWDSFYGVFIMLAAYIAGYVYLVWAASRDKKDLETIKTLDYCWRVASEILQRMPDGTSVEWKQGEGRSAEIRYFYDNNKKRAFRAMFGISSNTRRPVIVIFDMDTDDVAKYYSNPTPQLLEDPWYNFKPFYNPMAEQLMRTKMMMGRGKKGRRGGMSGLTINYGEGGGFEPDDDFADRAVDGGGDRGQY